MTDLLTTLNQHLAGQFAVEAEIGRGGMSIVYRAQDLRHHRAVALKILRPEIAHILGADRFLREIRIEAGLQHPNILPLLSSGEAGGIPYCVLPLIEGPTLRDRMVAEGALPVEDAVRIAADLARALDHAHRNGIVHRDIKPENVLLSQGRALLADFGVARAVTTVGADRLTSEGIVVGTPVYMSPEQSAGDVVDGRSDLYSLGIVLYEMLAGEPPFSGRTVQALTARHQTESPPPLSVLRPGVTGNLAAVVHCALAKVPADRFRTAADMLDAIEGRWTPPDPAAPARRRSLIRWGVLGVLLVAVALVYRGLNPPLPLDPTRIVVFPVPDSAGFDNQIPHAIELALDHTAPLSWIHGWDWLPEEVRRDPIRLTGPRMQNITRARGARYYISGEVTRSRDSTALVLYLHDVEGEVTLWKAGAASPRTRTDLAGTGLEAITRLLLEWRATGRHEFLVSLGSRSAGAVALQVQGEQEYRQGRFAPALDLFLRSLKEDSTWAYAAVKGAQAASWLARRDEAQRLIQLALRNRATLPSHYTDFALGLDAYFAGRADSAAAAFTRVVAAEPRWEEAHMALGDTYHHLLPSHGDLRALARSGFDAALEDDSTFTPAVRHRAEIAYRDGDLTRGDGLLRRMERIHADSQGVHGLRIMSACLRNQGSWSTLVRWDPLISIGEAQQFGAGGNQVSCAEKVYRQLLATSGLSESYAWTAVVGLAGLLISRNQMTEVTALVDSAIAGGAPAGIFIYLLASGMAPALEPKAAAASDYARGIFGDYYATATPHTRLALAGWHARRGEVAIVDSLLRQATAEAAAGDRRLRLFARALQAHAALARADTATALKRLEGLIPTAPLDSLEGDLFEPLGPETLLLAELLLGQRRFLEAYQAAARLDHGDLIYGPFIATSLAVRYRAARALGRSGDVSAARRRLELLGRADLIGQR